MSNNNSEENDDDLFLGDVKEQEDEINERRDDLDEEDIELGKTDIDHHSNRDLKLFNEDELSSVMTFTQVDQPHPNPDDEMFLTKLSSNIRIESAPFDRFQYRSMYNKRKIKNKDAEGVIRWRYKEDKKNTNNEDKERTSNAKIVEWEDGTMNLFIGDKIVYQLDKKPLTRGVNDLFCIPYSAKTTYVCDGILKDKLHIRKLGSTNFGSFEKKTRSLKLQETIDDPEYLKRQKEKESLDRKKRKPKNKPKPKITRKRTNDSPKHSDEEEEEEDVYEDDFPQHNRRVIDEESIYSAKSNPSQLNVSYKKRRTRDFDDDEDKEDIVVYDDDDDSDAPKEKERDALIIDDDDDDFN